jgi:hypothetical protein
VSWRPPDREDRQVAGLWAVCAVLAVGLRPLWLAGSELLPACLWHSLTGWPCPGCGTTRALTSLLRADLLGALAFNPLASAAAMAFVVVGLIAPVWLMLGGSVPRIPTRVGPTGLAVAALMFLANWAWLCASGV